jgi:hypothetical protein
MVRKLTLITLWLLTAGLATAFAAETPAWKPEIWFFIQQDTIQAMERLQFNEGFQTLLAGLPPDTPLRLYLFRSTEYNLVWQGPAKSARWPIAGKEFTLAIPSTTPYKNLLQLLKTEHAQDQKVVFVSNGLSQEMLMQEDTAGFFRGGQTFTPSRYPVLDEVVNYCKDHQIRLYGFYVGHTPPARGDLNDITFAMFRYVVEEPKGISYYNYNTFPGVFGTLLKDGALTR